MEKVGYGVDGRFHHGDQTADEHITGEQIGNGESHKEVSDHKGIEVDPIIWTVHAFVPREKGRKNECGQAEVPSPGLKQPVKKGGYDVITDS